MPLTVGGDSFRTMRTLTSRAQVQQAPAAIRRVATINLQQDHRDRLQLRAYAKPEGAPTANPDVLRTDIFGQTINAAQESRRRFGRSLTMDRIEAALNAAYRGSMRDITDILHETVDTDPHLGSVLNKRFGALSALPFEIQPASGTGIDRAKALYYADVVRTQLKNLRNFRRNINQLAWALFNGRACLEHQWIQLPPGSGPVAAGYSQPVMAVASMEWIHPRRLFFGPQREIRVQPEMNTGGGNFAPVGVSVNDYPDKFIYWLPQLFNEYPEREGLGMRCMYWSFFKRFAARERMILTELYGKPWRIVEVDQESTASAKDLTDADKIVDGLGASHTARMPRGTSLNVVSPIRSAGDVHAEVIAESDRQNSKLVLGQTGTTEAMPAGLNNSQANVMQDEQLGVLIRDAGQLSEVIEAMLTDRIIAVNFGESEVTHAPVFRLRADLPADRNAELERLQGSLNSGLSIQLQEAYEVSGFNQPDAGDVVLRIEQPPTAPNSPVAPAPRAVVIYPKGQQPTDHGIQMPAVPSLPPPLPDGDIPGHPTSSGAQVSPTDAKSTITVNEDRAARGLGPLTTAGGEEDPRGYLTVAEFEQQIISANAPAPAPSTAPSLPVAPPDPTAKPAASADPVPNPEDDPATDPPPKPDPFKPKVAAARIALARSVAEDIAQGDEPIGDGGMHAHQLLRDSGTTRADGRHTHVFKIGDQYLVTNLDGAHMHGLPTSDAAITNMDGEHDHAVVLNGVGMMTTSEEAAHQHALQAFATAVDGPHTHGIQIPGPLPGDLVTVRSMTPAEIAADMDAGLMPDVIVQQLEEPEDIHATERVFTTVNATRYHQRVAAMNRALGNSEDAIALVQNVERFEQDRAGWSAWLSMHGHADIILAKQPATPVGDLEDLTTRGLKELTLQTSTWASEFEAAVSKETTAHGIYGALAKARTDLSVDKFGRSLERRKLQAFMLGVLESVHELSTLAEAEENAPETSAQIQVLGLSKLRVQLEASTPFSKMSFKAALKHFQDLKVLARPAFERASAAIKQRSFTVAGVLGDQMLQVLQGDLLKSIQNGDDLRKFKAAIRPRLKDAGFLAQLGDLKNGQPALNASHVETVFRTNTLNTLNTGRYIHQTSPSVQAAFPVWEIRGVDDTRTRETHLNSHGKKLLATDPFWQTAYPPFGFNCRCRVIARSKKYMEGVVTGSSLSGLPDRGFTSGKPALSLG